MERMKKVIGKRKVEIHKMEGLYPYVRLEDFMYVVKQLEEENKKLNIKVASLEGEIKGLNYTIDKLREELSAYDQEYFDEDKKTKNIYKTQYEHSMGEDDELIYEEGLYD